MDLSQRGWSYQENLISDYHRKFGHVVTVITQTSSYNSEGYIVETTEDDKVTHNGVRLIRLKKMLIGSRFESYSYHIKYTIF